MGFYKRETPSRESRGKLDIRVNLGASNCIIFGLTSINCMYDIVLLGASALPVRRTLGFE